MEMDWPALSGIGVAASGILTIAWKKLSMAIKYVYAEVSKRIDECEDDRKKIKEDLDTMRLDMVAFKSCDKEPCGARDAIKRAHSFSVNPKQAN